MEAEDGTRKRKWTGIRILTYCLLGAVLAGLAAQEVSKYARRAMAQASRGPGYKTRVGEALPDFDLRDVAGQRWRLADLKGKLTYVNVWATWCGPCRAELPEVQKIHERLKDKPGVLVLTMNVDEEPELVKPFLEKNRYTFPAIFARSYVRGTLQTKGIPRNWVVDQSGVFQFDRIGFDSSGRWIKDLSQLIEKLRPSG